MNAATERQTATIIQFPVGGIRGRRVRNDRAEAKVEVDTGRYSDLAFGGGWYHDNAIKAGPDSTGKPS
ncbi:DUF2735 domain-containing protein [Allorhizobium pseudoryzae]|uniref:DUF2735 domain-containing protein n=1 Tax=Allorhizobium pseudoryzae TaxID=379684 RepID=UPI003D032735